MHENYYKFYHRTDKDSPSKVHRNIMGDRFNIVAVLCQSSRNLPRTPSYYLQTNSTKSSSASSSAWFRTRFHFHVKKSTILQPISLSPPIFYNCILVSPRCTDVSHSLEACALLVLFPKTLYGSLIIFQVVSGVRFLRLPRIAYLINLSRLYSYSIA